MDKKIPLNTITQQQAELMKASSNILLSYHQYCTKQVGIPKFETRTLVVVFSLYLRLTLGVGTELVSCTPDSLSCQQVESQATFSSGQSEQHNRHKLHCLRSPLLENYMSLQKCVISKNQELRKISKVDV